MMAAPPEPSHVEGPICKICKKSMRSHSYHQQQECFREAKKKGIDLV